MHLHTFSQECLFLFNHDTRKFTRLPIIHGETFRKVVQKTNPSVHWIVYSDKGHGGRSPANQIDFWNRAAQFLDKNLTAP